MPNRRKSNREICTTIISLSLNSSSRCVAWLAADYHGKPVKSNEALVPPNPKLFVIAALTGISSPTLLFGAYSFASSPPCSISCSTAGSACATRRLNASAFSRDLSTFSRVRLTVGGQSCCFTASTVKTASTAPAAPSKCPTAPLVDETATGADLCGRQVSLGVCAVGSSHPPKTEAMAVHSRPSPIGVDVACALM